jgi:hypothetical protein
VEAEVTELRLVRRYVSPQILFLGVAVGLSACAVAGWSASHRNPYRNFVRFHQLLNPESLYYPTASQMKALVKATARPGTIAVIVGGSSVMNGVGQTPRRIWTKRLQDLLGEPYRVVNLAFRAGSFTEAGALAAESMIKDGDPVIFVSDLSYTPDPSPLGRLYGYLFWDAYYKNLLIDDPAREAHVRAVLARSDATARRVVFEHRLGGVLDSALRFNDLWNSLAYRRLFTVWNFLTIAAPFQARRSFADNSVPAGPPAQRYPESSRDDLLERIRLALARRIRYEPDGRRTVVAVPRPWDGMTAELETSLPLAVRQRTLVVVDRPSPHYVDLLTGEEQATLGYLVERTVSALQDAGYEATSMGQDLTAEDYADLVHLVPSGGAKLAALVAPRVRALAERLGYTR